MSGKQLRLEVELVPRTAWGKNLRTQLPRREWEKIRTNVCAYQGNKCGICEAEGRLICHEIWEYDDRNHVQKLTGFMAVCHMCNNVIHLGHATVLAARGKVDMSRVEEHFMKVNDCDLQTFRKHALEAGLQCMERSKHQWRLDLGKYKWKIK
jgi:hypothetical protein